MKIKPILMKERRGEHKFCGVIHFVVCCVGRGDLFVCRAGLHMRGTKKKNVPTIASDSHTVNGGVVGGIFS